MKKITHLQKVIVVMAATVLISVGSTEWWIPIYVALTTYYFAFTLNLFVRLYDNDSTLTRIFFRETRMPMYVAMISIVAAILVLKRVYPEASFANAYISAGIGGIASFVGQVKRGRLKLRES